MAKSATLQLRDCIVSEPVSIRPLTQSQQLDIVQIFEGVLEGVYAHLPQKRAMYGQDPVQRLRLLEQRVRHTTADKPLALSEFHRSMAEILTDLRDAHTRYVVGLNAGHLLVDMLPLMVEHFTEADQSRGYLVSKVTPMSDKDEARFAKAGFVAGVEITHWNAVPIDRAVELYSVNETGGRDDAKRARALESLTLRPRYFMLPPDSDWVTVTYRPVDSTAATGGQAADHDQTRDIRLNWCCLKIGDLDELDSERPADYARAMNPAAESARRAKKMLFATNAWHDQDIDSNSSKTKSKRTHTNTRTLTRSALPTMDDAQDLGRFSRNAHVSQHEFEGQAYGYLRLWSFDLLDDVGFVNTVANAVSQLPKNGLIVDVRSNPGGLIWAAERLLQLFTPNTIEPTRFSMLASDVTRSMASAPQNRWRLEAWRRSLDAAIANADLYSAAIPMTARDRCNDVGQSYSGPVLCVVDANTYSAGDLFAAGFIDNRIGPMVSVDGGTGAGGANVWTEAELLAALPAGFNGIRALPEGVSYTVAIRRASRAGLVGGGGIEDVGVTGNFEIALTRDDLLDNNRDLLSYCASLLAGTPRTDLNAHWVDEGLQVSGHGLNRIAVYDQTLPIAFHTLDTRDDFHITIPMSDSLSPLSVMGYSGYNLRQRRVVHQFESDTPDN